MNMHFLLQLLTRYEKSARRSRERQKKEYSELLAKYNEYLEEIQSLENRVEALEKILNEASIEIPENLAGTVVQNITTAKMGGDMKSTFDEEAVVNDEVFQEAINSLENDSYERE